MPRTEVQTYSPSKNECITEFVCRHHHSCSTLGTTPALTHSITDTFHSGQPIMTAVVRVTHIAQALTHLHITHWPIAYAISVGIDIECFSLRALCRLNNHSTVCQCHIGCDCLNTSACLRVYIRSAMVDTAYTVCHG